MRKISAMPSVTSSAPAPHRVVVLALDQVVGYDMVIPPQLFGRATFADGSPRYQVSVAGLRAGEPLDTEAGYHLVPQDGPEVLASADTVVVPGTRAVGPRQRGELSPELAQAWSLIRPGTRIMSICTGAFVLGAAGVLDGRRATTHWAYADQLAALYPKVRVEPDVLFVDEGDVLTSAGLGAGVDLVLHVIRADHGQDVANHVARYCVVPPWRTGGQAQYIERALPDDDDRSTASARQWAMEHLGEALRVADLARVALMSERTFTRRFRTETGMSPNAWLVQQRLARAQELLEGTALAIDQVAADVGFGTGAALRAQMRAVLGTSPSAYRATFRGSSGAA